jgi:hypothetical protein
MRPGRRHPLRFHRARRPLKVASLGNSSRSNSRVVGCLGRRSHRGMVGKDGDVLRTLQIYLQREGPHGGLSVEGERSSMVEDTPTAAEHGH